MKGQTDLFKIVKMIWQRAYQPVIVFSFSKRDCESYALQMSKLNFNDDTEKCDSVEALLVTLEAKLVGACKPTFIGVALVFIGINDDCFFGCSEFVDHTPTRIS